MKPEPLGTELNNLACSRFREMLHPDILKGEESMKTSEFQKKLGGTSECMKRLAIFTKGCGQLTYNYTYFGDSCFSSVETAKDAMTAGVEYYGPLKTSHRGFF